MSSDDRKRVLSTCGVFHDDGWLSQFFVMLTLSVIVAVMGLDADSPALVIGAMLIAPLMAPVMGVAASLSMALFRRALRSLFIVAIATAGAVGLSYLVAKLLPDGPLPGEVLARTRPDIRDLIVGLAAGGAGAYATIRSDMSSSLPGVAVAVALVPPLCVVGYTLEAGQPSLARGAFLLYSANLAAIVFAGIVVFVVTGLIPQRRLARMTPRVVLGTAIAAAALVVMAVPLGRASASAFAEARIYQQTYDQVDEWVGERSLEISEIRIDGNAVSVQLRGSDLAPFTEDLRPRLLSIIGPNVEVDVRSVQTIEAEREQIELELPEPTDEEKFAVDVAVLVDRWLLSAGDPDLEVTDLEVTLKEVRGVIEGPGQPPNIADLESLIFNELHANLDVLTMELIATVPLLPVVEDVVTPEELFEIQVREVAFGWAESTSDSKNPMVVLAVELTAEGVIVDVTGPRSPTIDELDADLRALFTPPDEAVVVVRYVPRRVLDTTPPTTVPPPTTLPPPTTGPSQTTTPPDTPTPTSQPPATTVPAG